MELKELLTSDFLYENAKEGLGIRAYLKKNTYQNALIYTLSFHPDSQTWSYKLSFLDKKFKEEFSFLKDAFLEKLIKESKDEREKNAQLMGKLHYIKYLKLENVLFNKFHPIIKDNKRKVVFMFLYEKERINVELTLGRENDLEKMTLSIYDPSLLFHRRFFDFSTETIIKEYPSVLAIYEHILTKSNIRVKLLF